MTATYTNLYAVPKDSFDQYIRHRAGNFGNVKNIRVQQLNINEADEIYPTQNGPPAPVRRPPVRKKSVSSDNLSQVNVTPPYFPSPKRQEFAPPTPEQPPERSVAENSGTKFVPESVLFDTSPEPMDTTPPLTDEEILEHSRRRESRFPYISTPVTGVPFPGGQDAPGFTPSRLIPENRKTSNLSPISAKTFYGTVSSTTQSPPVAPFFGSTPNSKRQRFQPAQNSSFIESFPNRFVTSTPVSSRGKKRKREEPDALRKKIAFRQWQDENLSMKQERLMNELGAALDSAESEVARNKRITSRVSTLLRKSKTKNEVPRLFALADRALPPRLKESIDRGTEEELAKSPVAERLRQLERRLQELSRVDKSTSISRQLDFDDSDQDDPPMQWADSKGRLPLADSKGRLPLLIDVPPPPPPPTTKRPRGRPRIYFGPKNDPNAPKRPRGRPRKNPDAPPAKKGKSAK
jgi:hypothetical protein